MQSDTRNTKAATKLYTESINQGDTEFLPETSQLSGMVEHLCHYWPVKTNTIKNKTNQTNKQGQIRDLVYIEQLKGR